MAHTDRPAAQASPAQHPLAGRVVAGRYRVLAEIGSGGAGTVLRAEHLQLGNVVALKLLRAEHAASEHLLKRFEREARALAALRHPHIVAVTDYGFSDGEPFLATELLEGETLRERLLRGPLAPDRALAVTRQLLRALAYAHSRGFVHRDLKPENIFLQALPDGDHVKVLDFGLVRMIHGDGGGSALTRTGVVLGTPAYMAPEQAGGEQADARTDVYAAGVILFEVLTGRRPFSGDAAELIRQHILAPMPSVRAVRPDLELSLELEAFIRQATAKAKNARFPDAPEMLAALDALPVPSVGAAFAPTPAALERTAPPERGVEARGGPRRRFGLYAAVAAGVAATAVIVVVVASDGEPSPEIAVAPPSPPRPPAAVSPPAPGPAVPASGRPAPLTTPAGIEPPVSPLADIRAAIEEGRVPGRDADRRLIGHAFHDREDPEPNLLLARIYLARGWRSDALEQYELAYRKDHRACDDPIVLDDLLMMAIHPSIGSRAAAAVERLCGAAAIPVIDLALESPELAPDAAARLRALRDRLPR